MNKKLQLIVLSLLMFFTSGAKQPPASEDIYFGTSPLNVFFEQLGRVLYKMDYILKSEPSIKENELQSNGVDVTLFKLIKEIQGSKDVSNISDWLKQPLTQKEKQKLSFRDRFIKVISEKNISQEKKSELINLSNLQTSDEFNIDKLILKLEEFSITLGDFWCLKSASVYKDFKFYYFNDEWQGGDHFNSNTGKSFITSNDSISICIEKMYRKLLAQALLKLWKYDVWIFKNSKELKIEPNSSITCNSAERVLFMSKYFYSDEGFADKKYLDYIQTKCFNEIAGDFLKEISYSNNFFVIQPLRLLKQAGVTKLKGYGESCSEESQDIDYILKKYILNHISSPIDKKIGFTIETDNECILSNRGRDVTFATVEGIININYRDIANANFTRYKIGELDENITIGNIGKIQEVSQSSKKLFSEEINPTESIANEDEMARKEENEAVLKIIFKKDITELKKSLDLISELAENINDKRINKSEYDIILKEIINWCLPKLDPITERLDSSVLSKSKFIVLKDTIISSLKEIIYQNNIVEYLYIPNLEFYNFIIEYGKNKNDNAKKAIGFIKEIIKERYDLVYSKLTDSAETKQAKEKFAEVFKKMSNENEHSVSRIEGSCFYSNSEWSGGIANFLISKGNNFSIKTYITNDYSGNTIDIVLVGRITIINSDKYLLKSNKGDYILSFEKGKCGEGYLYLKGLGNNNTISFKFNNKKIPK